ncbi:helix-turn-helix transcriptional regulator [Nocardia cyriacigeorgica]|uniref:Helix-turn-helix transcriptional regulator n=1 Tax=Nocardia cyriacigeorgica TaxID=135487 RepID=A0ABX0CCV7_9NOCA|nr:helix-turn-helix transcriptional regulator [Nocardia cyriacigeorgica]NEW40754.1 helix-turn-helix transcriptional regulator [Nocardia cyriacigeorgica]NEW51018.1 helix-turn-helix transcriptional regulator [Nocardia cyriacigeorgica]NEW54398.1 helix-turn-helix transcriptional regulator [Nocardia cyriacigeorgica]
MAANAGQAHTRGYGPATFLVSAEQRYMPYAGETLNLLRELQHRWEHLAMGIRQRRTTRTPSQVLAGELAKEEIELKRSLVEAREKAGLSQSQLADMIGVHRSVISRFERIDSNPRLSMLRYYAHALGVLIRHRVEPFTQASLEARRVDVSFAEPRVAYWAMTHTSLVTHTSATPTNAAALCDALTSRTTIATTMVNSAGAKCG